MSRRRSEFQQIADLFAPLATHPGALGLKDDAAVLNPPPGQALVTTVDAIVCGVHYLPEDPPDLIARKLMRVNLSDLAAMGAVPAGVLLACAFAKSCSDVWVETFVQGLGDDTRAFACPVLGGDTVATDGPPVFSITAFGWVPQGRAMLRSGARPGDLIAVTGTIGDGAFGLDAARYDASTDAQGDLFASTEPWVVETLADRYHLPRPRLEAGGRLRGLASAAMDVSDGLVQDLGHICAASGVSADLDRDKVPLSSALHVLFRGQQIPWDRILTGGDDYELLVTLPAEKLDAAMVAVGETGLTVIGQCLPPRENTPSVRIFSHGDPVPLKSQAGWQHF